MVETKAKVKSPRGKGPKNSFGFRHGTRAALVSDLISARPMGLSALKKAVEREFGETTDDQFRSLIDFVTSNLRKRNHEVKQERVLYIPGAELSGILENL